MITPSTVPSTNSMQLPRVRGVKPPKLGVTAPKVGRYKPARIGGFAAPKVPSIAPQA